MDNRYPWREWIIASRISCGMQVLLDDKYRWKLIPKLFIATTDNPSNTNPAYGHHCTNNCRDPYRSPIIFKYNVHTVLITTCVCVCIFLIFLTLFYISNSLLCWDVNFQNTCERSEFWNYRGTWTYSLICTFMNFETESASIAIEFSTPLCCLKKGLSFFLDRHQCFLDFRK